MEAEDTLGQLTGKRRDLVLNHMALALLEVVLGRRKLLVHLGTLLSALSVLALEVLVTRVSDNTNVGVLGEQRSLLEGDVSEVAGEGTVDLDEGNIVSAVAGSLNPLSGGDDALAETGLDVGSADGGTTRVANVALDLGGALKAVTPVVDDMASGDDGIRADEPAGAHHPDAAVALVEASLNLDDSW